MKIYDVAIIGGGPAGLTAALYLRRANKSVLIIEKATFGGQITFSPKVENIPGFASLSGNEFAEKLAEQVMAQGADFEMCEVTGVSDADAPLKTIHTDEGDLQAYAVILAAGARHRTLGLPGEEERIGNGISFCAVCDGAFYTGKTVGVVGGGNSALQEALLLADLAKEVHIFQNLAYLTGEDQLRRQLEERKNVQIHLGVTVEAYLGTETELTGIRVRTANGETEDYRADGIFLAVGLLPQNEPFSGIVSLDERGYILAGEDCTTNTSGIFAAGDCRKKKIRQVVTAAGDGAVAAIAAADFVDAVKGK